MCIHHAASGFDGTGSRKFGHGLSRQRCRFLNQVLLVRRKPNFQTDALRYSSHVTHPLSHHPELLYPVLPSSATLRVRRGSAFLFYTGRGYFPLTGDGLVRKVTCTRPSSLRTRSASCRGEATIFSAWPTCTDTGKFGRKNRPSAETGLHESRHPSPNQVARNGMSPHPVKSRGAATYRSVDPLAFSASSCMWVAAALSPISRFMAARFV